MTTQENKYKRVAIVTGGSQGIGLAIAKQLSDQGMWVAIGARRAGDSDVEHAVRSVVRGQVMIAALDVRDAKSVDQFVANISQRFGTADVLVNAAGISVHQTIEGHSDEQWLDTIETNLNGPFRMIRACLPNMKKNSWGRIVNIASTAAHTAAPTHGAYCASKAGLLGLTRAVALEGAPHGVTCVAISPGWVETSMLQQSAVKIAKRSGRTPQEEIRLMAASNPQNRLVQPEEIAALVAFCCSEAAAGLTMEDIQVNAGAWW